MLLAESHVFTAPGDSAARPLSGEALARLEAAGYDGPTGFVHLVHSLGYGEDDLLATPAGANKGTPQFWQLLAATASATTACSAAPSTTCSRSTTRGP